MKLIITGASGFVGKNLLSFMKEKGHQTEALSLRGSDWTLPLNGEVLIHLAGKAHDTANTSSPSDYFQINTELTKKLFDQFLGSSIKDFIYFSSVKAVADTVEGEALTEELIPNPKTPYGQSKFQAEEYLLKQDLPPGKRLFILRPCMIHGAGNKGNLNLLYKVVQKGIPYPLGAFRNKRSFLSIDNLLFVLEKIIDNPRIPGGVYNVSDDEPISTNELIKIIAHTGSASGRIWHIPRALVIGMAKLGDLLPIPLNSERLKKLTESYVVSNSKIKSVLNIDHLPMTVQQGLQKTLQSFPQK